MSLVDYKYADTIATYYSFNPKLTLKKIKELDPALRDVFAEVLAYRSIQAEDKRALNAKLFEMQNPNYKFKKKTCTEKAEAATQNIRGTRITAKDIKKTIRQFTTHAMTRFARLPNEVINTILSKQVPQNSKEFANIFGNYKRFSQDLGTLDISPCINWISEKKLSINMLFAYGLKSVDVDAIIPHLRHLEVVDIARFLPEEKLKDIYAMAQNVNSLTILPGHLSHFQGREKITHIELQFGIIDKVIVDQILSFKNLKSLNCHICQIPRSSLEALKSLPCVYTIESCIS